MITKLEKCLRRDKVFRDVDEIKAKTLLNEEGIIKELSYLEKKHVVQKRGEGTSLKPFQWRFSPKQKIIHSFMYLGSRPVYLCRNSSIAPKDKSSTDINDVTCQTCLKIKEGGIW